MGIFCSTLVGGQETCDEKDENKKERFVFSLNASLRLKLPCIGWISLVDRR